MMIPSIFRESLFDDFMDNFGFPDFPSIDKTLYGKHTNNVMNTDVKETDKSYEIDIDLPGFKKDEIKMQLVDGYLTVSATKAVDRQEKDKKGSYIRRERYAGNMSRSFYVGKNITENDIHPKYENGILTFTLPKVDTNVIENKPRYISIEG